MQKYEVSREIYNPCAGIYNFDMNFEEEVCTDNIEEVLEKWIHRYFWVISVKMPISF